jgi:uncharacterized membrane protein YqiK
MDLSHLFNQAAIYGPIALGGLAAAGIAAWKGPRQLEPDNENAKIVTARNFPNIFKSSKIVAHNGIQMYLGMGASKVTDVPLKTFKVNVERNKKEAVILGDNVKAELVAEFYVRVDTSTPQNIIRALESLSGDFSDKKIEEFCKPQFDDALRSAASKLTIETMQSERKDFLEAVKNALSSLEETGLKLVDVSLLQMNQAPLADFDPNNFFDAKGLKKVKEVIEESLTAVNNTEQTRKLEREERNKEAAKQALIITEEQRKATLEQEQRVKELEANQARAVAEFQAEQQKQAKLAELKAAQETDAQQIQKDKTIAVANETKAKELAIAAEDRAAAAEQAKIAKNKTVELAEQDKRIALHQKTAEEAKAQTTANEAKAKAVEAEQAVVTATKVAEAERSKKVAVIAAEQTAETAAAGKRIDADATVYVAQKEAEASTTRATSNAQSAKIEAAAAAEAAELKAKGVYAETYQPLKAQADGDFEKAKALEALNKAVNTLSDEARRQQVDLERVKITPEVVEKWMLAVGNIDNLNVTHFTGAPGIGGSAQGGGAQGASAPGNILDQFVSATQRMGLEKVVLGKLIESIGGDKRVADGLPSFGSTAPAGNDNPVPAAAAPAAAPAAPAAPSATTAAVATAVTAVAETAREMLAPVAAPAPAPAPAPSAPSAEGTTPAPKRATGGPAPR